MRYQYETPPCTVPSLVESSAVACVKPGTWPLPHPEPLNCGQLLITSLAFAQTVWDSRPAQFMNGDKSQQYYANVAKHNFSHGGLPLDYYNYCWRKEVSIVNKCRVATMHATCGQSSSDKGRLMHSFVKTFSGCALSNRTGRPLSPEATIREELKFE